MSVQSEIDRIITAVGNAYSKVSEKGGTVPASQTVSNLATAIDSITAGVAKETWVLNEKLNTGNTTYTIDFTSNGTRYSKLTVSPLVSSRLKYGDILVYGKRPGGASSGWIDQAYRKLTFDAPPTGVLLTWLQKNGVKQPDDTAVQDTKEVTITSNGTVSVTPDAPYDALKKVDVIVNVASVSTVTIHCTVNDSAAFWLSPDGVFHKTNLKEGANTIIVNTYSPIGVYNLNGFAMDNLNNIVNSGGGVMLGDNTTYQFYYYHIYYATATTASATLPSD